MLFIKAALLKVIFFIRSTRSKALTLMQSWSSAITLHYNNPEQICVENNRSSTLSPHDSFFPSPLGLCITCSARKPSLHVVFVILVDVPEKIRIYINKFWRLRVTDWGNMAPHDANLFVKLGHSARSRPAENETSNIFCGGVFFAHVCVCVCVCF